MINGDIDGIEISVFREYEDGKKIREDWEPEKYINTVNAGAFEVNLTLHPQECEVEQNGKLRPSGLDNHELSAEKMTGVFFNSIKMTEKILRLNLFDLAKY